MGLLLLLLIIIVINLSNISFTNIYSASKFLVNNLKLMDFVDSVLFGYNILFRTKGRVPKNTKKGHLSCIHGERGGGGGGMADKMHFSNI